MSVGASLRAALRDMYENSWRLLALNGALATLAVAAAVAASYAQPALLLFLLLGPAAAALMHCAVKLQQTDELRVADALEGLRLHWRRGLALGALVGGVVALAVLALAFYSRPGFWAWPLAIAVVYVLALFGVWQLHLWPIAVFERSRSLKEVVPDAALQFARRPLATLALAFWLLFVNAVGAVGILPVLTLTVAYSFLAAAHFALPQPTEEAAG
jgi:uncharacterized membrane protein YesL